METYAMANGNENTDGYSPSQRALRKRLEGIRDEAIALASAAARISQAAQQSLERGGILSIQPQVAFVTGAQARMMKDWGVVEHLQGQGVVLKKPAAVK